MALSTHILVTHGYLVVFVWVLMEQLGVPVPSAPLLVAVGALSAEGQISFPLTLLSGLAASLMADTSWFFIGRRYRGWALRFLCKLSLEPSICVRRTQDLLRHRTITLMIAGGVCAWSWRRWLTRTGESGWTPGVLTLDGDRDYILAQHLAYGGESVRRCDRAQLTFHGLGRTVHRHCVVVDGILALF